MAERLRLRRSEDVVWEQLGEATLVLDAQNSRYVKLNRTGAALWEALAEPTDTDALVRRLVERHGVDEERAAADVEAFLSRLRERGLVVAL
jgi:hypothetical protein